MEDLLDIRAGSVTDLDAMQSCSEIVVSLAVKPSREH